MRFIYALVVMVSPICPHWSENIWSKLRDAANQGILGDMPILSESVCNTPWPAFTPFDKLVRKQYIFFRDFLKNARQAAIKSKVNGPKSVIVYLANTFEEKKILLLRWMQTICDTDGGFPDDLLKRMKEFVENDNELKKDTKMLMQFGAFMRDEARDRGIDALAEVAPFNQMAILKVFPSILLTDILNDLSLI